MIRSTYNIENYFITWLYAETKDFRNEFCMSSHNGAIRQAFCKPYGFVPPCSLGALVTLPHVGTVPFITDDRPLVTFAS